MEQRASGHAAHLPASHLPKTVAAVVSRRRWRVRGHSGIDRGDADRVLSANDQILLGR